MIDNGSGIVGCVGWFLKGLRDNLFFQIPTIVLLAIVVYVVSIVFDVLPSPFPTTHTTLPASISIYEKCYHLGDDTRSDLCPEAPQADPFERKFQIDQINGSAYIRLTVKEVSPNETRDPIRIYVNGSFVDYLNRYVTEETSDSKEIEIPVAKEILHIGENNILIFSSPYVNTSEKGVDDFEFRNLNIVFK